MSSDDEPDWLLEQSSAQKESATARRRESSDSFSLTDDEAGPPSEPGEGVEEGDGSKGAKAAGAKAKSSGKRAPPSARLPLLFAPKVRKDMMLLEANDAGLDLSGDFGCIGKLHVKKSGGGAGSSS